MRVAVSWDNDEHTTIRYDFEVHWTWNEFFVAASDAYAMTLSVSHKVNTISNFKPGATLPSNTLFQFRRAMVNAPKNRGVWVIVGASSTVKTMVGLFAYIDRSLGQRLILVDSLEEARRFLAQRCQ